MKFNYFSLALVIFMIKFKVIFMIRVQVILMIKIHVI